MSHLNDVCLWLGVFTKPHKPYKLQKPHQNRPQNGITAPYRKVQCGLQFYNKKTAQTAPHPSIY